MARFNGSILFHQEEVRRIRDANWVLFSLSGGGCGRKEIVEFLIVKSDPFHSCFAWCKMILEGTHWRMIKGRAPVTIFTAQLLVPSDL
jgi:hypothetical protein